jgi:hypothetical protein
MPHDEDVQKRCDELNLNAPRLRLEAVEARVASETYTKLPSGKALVCELILQNGYSVTGVGSCVSRANYNDEIARTVSRKKALDAVWQLEGYLLQNDLFVTQDKA